MGKKLEYTPKGRIKNALRQVFLRSRERAAALKREGYCCQACGVKQSKAKGKEVKIEVHHIFGVGNWDKIYDIIYEQLLCHHRKLDVLCKPCHKKVTKRQQDKILHKGGL